MSTQVWHVSVDTPLLEVGRLLAERKISCAVVTDRERPVGILSERDLVRESAAAPTGWTTRTAGETMVHPLFVIAPEASVAEAIAELGRRNIRRLPVVSRQGRLCGIVTQTDLLRAAHVRLQEYARDLERVVAERTWQLRESERQRNDLVDLTVHDIKNWTHATASAVEVLEMDDQQLDNMLSIIRHSTRSITTLVSTLLDVNRLEGGWMPLRLSDVPWSSVCGPVVEDLSAMARTKELGIVATGDMQLIVRCDQQLVERILLNLLDNAVSVAPRGTTIEVRTTAGPDGGVVVRIGNRGPVIPASLLPNLFRKHQQGTDRVRGWGLGLTFCRLAVEHHGGAIGAISPYVDGEGAAFEFRLPPDPAPRRTGPGAAETAPTDAAKPVSSAS
ncbi:MAG TPA: CBS domain-containing protein [Candidatus Binatia bacterium]